MQPVPATPATPYADALDGSAKYMGRPEAIELLDEALDRLREPQPNANGGEIQIGAIYWRLLSVLADHCDPLLDSVEGAKHASFLRRTHADKVDALLLSNDDSSPFVDPLQGPIENYCVGRDIVDSLELMHAIMPQELQPDPRLTARRAAKILREIGFSQTRYKDGQRRWFFERKFTPAAPVSLTPTATIPVGAKVTIEGLRPAAAPLPPLGTRINDDIFVGIHRTPRGDEAIWINVSIDAKATWQAAIDMAAQLATTDHPAGTYHLPTVAEQAIAIANAPEHFTKGWYWTGTQYSPNYAWIQLSDGFQFFDHKDTEFLARPVRSAPI